MNGKQRSFNSANKLKFLTQLVLCLLTPLLIILEILKISPIIEHLVQFLMFGCFLVLIILFERINLIRYSIFYGIAAVIYNPLFSVWGVEVTEQTFLWLKPIHGIFFVTVYLFFLLYKQLSGKKA